MSKLDCGGPSVPRGRYISVGAWLEGPRCPRDEVAVHDMVRGIRAERNPRGTHGQGRVQAAGRGELTRSVPRKVVSRPGKARVAACEVDALHGKAGGRAHRPWDRRGCVSLL